MSELTRLLEQAASNLSSHPCKVRFRKPARADARAGCFKLGDVAMIDLHPGYTWDGDELLFIIAHEAAHIRDLWDEWQGIPDLPSGSVTFSQRALASPVIEQIENDADELALRWVAHAKRNHMKYIIPGDDNSEFTLHLRALSKMDERELMR